MTRTVPFLLALTLLVACNDTPAEESSSSPEEPEQLGPTETVYSFEEDLVWSQDTVVAGVWYVPAGVTLRVAAGIEVSFLPGTGLVVDGALVLEGTAEAPVRFTNAASLSVGNFGVSVGGSGDLSQLDHGHFVGVSLYLEGGAASGISGASFDDASLVISGRAETFSVVDSIFVDGNGELQDGIVATELGSLSVQSSVFSNLRVGVQFDGGGSDPELLVSNSSFERVTTAIVSGLAGLEHRVALDGVTVNQTSLNGIDLFSSSASVANSLITNVSGHGVAADAASALVLSDSTVSGATFACVAALGSAETSDLILSDCGGAGLWAGAGGCTMTGGTVSDTDESGLRCEGPLEVTGTSFARTGRSAVYVIDADALVTGVQIVDSQGSGVHSYIGDLEVTGTSISGTVEAGIFAHHGSVTVSETSISDSRIYGIRSYQGGLTVTSNVVIDEVDSHAVVVDGGALNLSGLSISDVGGAGIYGSDGNASISGIQVQDTGSHGVQVVDGDLTIDLTVGPVEVVSTRGNGIAVSGGNLDAAGFSVGDAALAGVEIYQGHGQLSSCTIDAAGGHGISARQSGQLLVSDCAVTNSYNNGVLLSEGGTLTLSDVSVLDSGLTGVKAYRSVANITDSTVRNSGQYGVYVYDGALSLSGSSVANSVSHGVLASLADATLSGVLVVDQSAQQDQPGAGATGVTVIGGLATITDSLIDKAQSYGIRIESGSISGTRVSNGGLTGIYVSGHSASLISGCDVVDNLYRGIQTIYFGNNLTDISDSNITGNGDWGVVYGQSLTGNYIANNKSLSGADLTEGGTLDGVRDTSGTQVFSVDNIVSAAAQVVSDTGPDL
ncbi:MAG: hypothetical protein CMP23_03260 [Rickettsiales bacterium]|nr:hypothetical protein [Rickettsiales bacterium]|tara:strand:+ start:493 stop:3012 length:2520 start_codon:yes stop_codon:yes gene_type:complete